MIVYFDIRELAATWIIAIFQYVHYHGLNHSKIIGDHVDLGTIYHFVVKNKISTRQNLCIKFKRKLLPQCL